MAKPMELFSRREMNSWIGPCTVKHVWNDAMHALHYYKHNSLPLGPIEPSSHATKELHAKPVQPKVV